jgi:hypothetical protein
MKKQLILHIGCEKTGTTSIQNTLAANRDTLLNQYGYYYPSSLGHKNHTKLAIYCCNEDKNLTRFLPEGVSLEEFRRNLQQQFFEEIRATSSRKVIISCEWLQTKIRDDDEFARLKTLLSDLFDEVRVIIYLRRQDKIVLSRYSTWLKAGSYKRFTFPEIKHNEKLPYSLNFLGVYNRWKSNFEPNKLLIRVFDRKVLHHNDVVKDFLIAVGCELDGIKFSVDDNLSLNWTGIQVLRALNYVLYYSRRVVSPQLSRNLRHCLANYFIGKAKLASDEECRQFVEHFKEVNAELEETYFQDSQESINLF